MKKKLSLAALAVNLTEASAPVEFRLLPAGSFRAQDGSGRPAEVAAGWLLDDAQAARLVALAANRATDYAIDYEHQSLRAATNGQPAPAAGWFKQLEWRPSTSSGQGGLYAVEVRWTERAAALIAAGEYRYISPVFSYNPQTGVVTGLGPAALTNNPALDGLTDLAALSSLVTSTENTMNLEELLERIRYLLNLPALATVEDVAAELQKAVDIIKSGAAAETVAASALGVAGAIVALTGQIAALTGQIAALKAAAPDPALYVPVAVMQSLQAEVAALRAEKLEGEVAGIVGAALTAGRLMPAQEAWARELGKSNMALLKQYAEGAPPVAALSGTQTGGKSPVGTAAGILSESAQAVCSVMGISPEEFRRTAEGM